MHVVDWHGREINDVVKALKTDRISGLSGPTAAALLEKGRNVIVEKKKNSPWRMFFAQFTDTMVLVLLGATVLSCFLGDIIDAATILIIVILNGVLGFVQEYRAEKSLEAIKKLSSPHALVVRDGKHLKVPAADLVEGDLVLLEAGDRVPADLRLVESFSLEIEESCLTGESVPVSKKTDPVKGQETALGDRFSMAYMGTMITRGRGSGLVVATGMKTIMGEIASMIQQSAEEPTPLQSRLDSLGKVLIVICVASCLVVMLLGMYRGENFMRMIMAGISLAVAAVPEGLPAIVTVVLALGVQRMAKRKAIVRKLPAVETLGCTTVICSDKTGTLTQNQMTVRKLATLEREYSVTGEGYEERGNVEYQGKSFEPGSDNILRTLIETGFLCNHSSIEKEKDGLTVLGDPTEGALVVLASKAGIKDKIKIEREIPFDSDRKMMSVVVKKDGTYRVYVKGALDVLLPRCIRVSSSKGDFPLSDKNQRHFSDLQEAWAGLAYRVLGFAYRSLSPGEVGKANDEQLESDLTLLGICGIIDPPRPAVFGAVQECLQAGIIPIMVTGDHPATALAIARQIGIYETGEVIGPAEIDRMSPEELAAAAVKVRVFARVSPQHKFKIVKVLKKKGHVVAMTGDGVNDAPAVREADIGVSMGIAGTEVTREASSMILADDDFATIVAAVHEGRSIFDNIRKFIRYLLGCNIGEVLTMFLSSLLGMPLPLLPIQILWVNLVTDGLPAMALGLEPPEPEIMKRAPRKGNESIFSRGMGWLITGRGIFIAISTLLIMVIGLTYTGLKGSQGLELARTMALTNLVFAQLFYVFECRSERYSPFDLGFLSNPYLVGAVLCSVTMQLLAVYLPVFNRIFGTTPLQAWHWGIILIIAGSGLIIKFLRYLISLVAGNRLGYVKLENVEAVTK